MVGHDDRTALLDRETADAVTDVDPHVDEMLRPRSGGDLDGDAVLVVDQSEPGDVDADQLAGAFDDQPQDLAGVELVGVQLRAQLDQGLVSGDPLLVGEHRLEHEREIGGELHHQFRRRVLVAHQPAEEPAVTSAQRSDVGRHCSLAGSQPLPWHRTGVADPQSLRLSAGIEPAQLARSTERSRRDPQRAIELSADVLVPSGQAGLLQRGNVHGLSLGRSLSERDRNPAARAGGCPIRTSRGGLVQLGETMVSTRMYRPLGGAGGADGPVRARPRPVSAGQGTTPVFGPVQHMERAAPVKHSAGVPPMRDSSGDAHTQPTRRGR